jgi:hypothetical protein
MCTTLGGHWVIATVSPDSDARVHCIWRFGPERGLEETGLILKLLEAPLPTSSFKAQCRYSSLSVSLLTCNCWLQCETSTTDFFIFFVGYAEWRCNWLVSRLQSDTCLLVVLVSLTCHKELARRSLPHGKPLMRGKLLDRNHFSLRFESKESGI